MWAHRIGCYDLHGIVYVMRARCFTWIAMACLAMPGTLIVSGCRKEARSTASSQMIGDPRITNLSAFARLYGVVRWFHPSDVAASSDWDQLAVDGAHLVADAGDCRALRTRLTDLFLRVAPTMQLAAAGEVFRDEQTSHMASTAGVEMVAWEHEGYGETTMVTGIYASKRRNRPRAVVVRGASIMALSQSFDAAAYRGRPVRLRGKVRAANHGKARLWLRVDRDEKTMFFDNMLRRPVTSGTWTDVELVGRVASDASRIALGVLVFEAGTSWYDSLDLAVQDASGTWQRIDLPDGDFEEATPLEYWQPGIGRSGPPASIDGWVVTLDRVGAASGAASLRVEPATRASSDELFQEAPRTGEAVDVELGCGLRARVPISLYSRAGHTIGDEASQPYRRASTASTASAVGRGFDVLSAAADVIIVWNVLQHFWPYWNLVPIDWNAELPVALADALANRDIDDHVVTLQRLSAAAPDGHATTHCSGERKLAPPPFALDEVEGSVVVTASEDKALERGDVLLSLDGEAALHALRRAEEEISGSPQWRRVGALKQLGYGAAGSNIQLVIRRGESELAITVPRQEHVVSPKPTHAAVERLDDGVYYVDLSRASMAEIEAAMAELAVAPGVVFDLRGYPNGNHRLLSHLLAVADNAKWDAAPHIIRPYSAASPSAWSWDGWNLSVAEPHIVGRVAFLIGPRAYSYSESIIGLVEHYHLGTLIGGITAGVNGETAQISTPMGCDTTFTGRLVTKLDGSRHYLVGFSPTIAVASTIAGVAAGRDEILEHALEFVRSGSH